jgi:hypothetical protein
MILKGSRWNIVHGEHKFRVKFVMMTPILVIKLKYFTSMMLQKNQYKLH